MSAHFWASHSHQELGKRGKSMGVDLPIFSVGRNQCGPHLVTIENMRFAKNNYVAKDPISFQHLSWVFCARNLKINGFYAIKLLPQHSWLTFDCDSINWQLFKGWFLFNLLSWLARNFILGSFSETSNPFCLEAVCPDPSGRIWRLCFVLLVAWLPWWRWT